MDVFGQVAAPLRAQLRDLENALDRRAGRLRRLDVDAADAGRPVAEVFREVGVLGEKLVPGGPVGIGSAVSAMTPASIIGCPAPVWGRPSVRPCRT
jgi:hypothetical protein